MDDRLIKVFRDAFPSLMNADRERITAATSESIEDWESVTMLTLLLLIEDEYEISIPDEVAVGFTSFLFIEDYLVSLGN